MRTILKNFKKLIAPLVAAGLLTMTISGCVKSHEPTTTNNTIAALAVINACPDGPAVDFYIGTSKITQSAIGLGQYTYYFSAYAGQSTALFYPTGTSTVEAQLNLNLKANTYYTLFLANVKATPDVILLTDSLFKPTSGSTVIRFVDVSPNAPNVDLYVKGGSKIASNLTYKGATSFFNVPLPAGKAALDTLQVVQTGTNNVLATVPATNFQGNAAYTVWFYGLANSTVTGEGLNAGVMEDVVFN